MRLSTVGLCRHTWGFPRRWPEFAGKHAVDVQTCSKCGVNRLSPVQFGRTEDPAAGDRP